MQKNILKFLLISIIIVGNTLALPIYARQGDSGFEGGISSGESPGKTSFEYKEVCFITGKPIVLDGTMTVKKTLKKDTKTGNDVVTTNYTYKLTNLEKAATLTRGLSYSTQLIKKDNGQTIEETVLNTGYSEVVKIGNTIYILRNYDFTKTNLIDSKPAVDYFAGNLWGKKTYQTGTVDSGGTVSVSIAGNFYGYNQYWGTTETQVLDYIIESESKNNNKVDKWGGTASVSISSTVTKQIRYVENKPEVISFEGGFVQNQFNNSILQYSAKLPEFDSEGVSTDRLLDTQDSLKIESFPSSSRLMVPELGHLRGHWAENAIKGLYSLEVFKGDSALFNPQDIMTRAEFADAIVLAAKEVPKDPLLSASGTSQRTARTGKNTIEDVVSPFIDVSTKGSFFESINTAYKRGIISGRGNERFAPEDYLSTADAITVIIKTLGLEGMSPSEGIVTSFRDNEDIPAYARSAVYVAQRIGLVQGDDRGYLKPKEHLTKARAAVIINKFINYMRDDLKKDYRERIVNY